ncbi:branched-chain amino acid ABC transporter permease [Nocardioides sp.]|jgi:branched-chain amino acid transport system permease protein|uniref:branched-chain amino acid ABC transporter permease n=1 Tax=Nocardioides sp. TaxID=35761 RepID=UPI002F414BE9
MSTTAPGSTRSSRRSGRPLQIQLPSFLRSRLSRVVMIALGVLLAYALPLIQPPFITTPASDFGGVMASAASFALVALGLNIVIGYAGLLDLGYVGFYAVGAYTTGVLTSQHGHWPFFLVLPCAMIVTTVSGLMLGAPAIRVRGDYLAIVTLGFGEIISLVAKNTPWLGSAAGIKNIPPPPSIGPDPIGTDQDGLFQIPHLAWNGLVPSVDNLHKTPFLTFGVLDAIPYYWLILTFILVVLVADMMVNNSRVGRAWEATREDEDAAELMGVPTFRYKLLAFMLGAAIGGLAGSLLAAGQGGFISPDAFPLLLSMLFVAAVIIGGAGNRWGAILGGVLVAYLPERFRTLSDYRLLIFGLSLMVIVTFRPQGILPPRRTRRALRAQAEVEELEGEVIDA